MNERLKKPDWLKIKLGNNEQFTATSLLMESLCLHTICKSGKCPNIGECWSRGTATFMIAGDICTRSCKFCNTKTGKPLPLNPNEPRILADTVKTMQLKHAVITSVDRDDLPDLGARHWVDTIYEIRKANPETTIEVLIPDFQGKADLIQQIIDAKPDVISHNMETVKRLSPLIRSAACYDVSLSVLKYIAESGVVAKSGVMLGLGETREEIEEVMDDLLSVGCSVLTIGQYLQPSRKNVEVYEYITLENFNFLQQIAQGKGFKFVESGPLVRSSYHAEKHVAPHNLYM